MKTPEQILREQIKANGIDVTNHDWQAMMLSNVTVKSAIEMAEIYKKQKRVPKQPKPKLRLVSFQLTMPNVGSWNGKWTGAAKQYYIIRKTRADQFLKDGETEANFHYSWNDGWGANIECQIVDSKEAAKRRKVSAGFCGYDWMVNNIIDHGSPYKL